MPQGFHSDKISIRPFVRVSRQLFAVTNRLENLGNWSELFHTCMFSLSVNHKQVKWMEKFVAEYVVMLSYERLA